MAAGRRQNPLTARYNSAIIFSSSTRLRMPNFAGVIEVRINGFRVQVKPPRGQADIFGAGGFTQHRLAERDCRRPLPVHHVSFARLPAGQRCAGLSHHLQRFPFVQNRIRLRRGDKRQISGEVLSMKNSNRTPLYSPREYLMNSKYASNR